MAESTFYRKKIVVDDLEATEINGIQGNVIDPDVNTIGQVLRITSLDPKAVAFEDNLPDTTPFVNGYVLKILDKDNNTYTWAEDSEGGTVPLILTGDNVQALTVRNTLNEPKFTVDTINSEIEVDDASLVLKESGTATQTTLSKTSTETIIATNENISIVATGSSTFNIETGKMILKEYNDVTRFAVRKQTSATIFNVDTSADIVTSFGETRVEGTDSASKFGVYTNADGINPVLGVDTLNQVVSMNASTINLDSSNIVIVDGVNQALMQTASASIFINGADTSINSNTIQISGATTTEFLTTTPVCAIAPTIDTHLTNRIYVENRLGYFASARDDATPLTEAQLVLTSIVPTLNGSLMVPPNYFQEGDAFTLVASGSFVCGNTQGITIQLVATDGLLNEVVLGSIVIANGDLNTSTASNFELEADFLCRKFVGGVTGEFVTSFDFTYLADGNTGFSGSRSTNTTTTLILAQSQMLDVRALFSNNGQSASLTTKLLYLKKMH